MAELGERHQVSVTGVAKIKTILQLVGVGAMLYTYPVFGFTVTLQLREVRLDANDPSQIADIP